jgi:hypothetical protein
MVGLIEAIKNGNMEIIKSLVGEGGMDLNSITDTNGDPPLVVLIRTHALSFKSMMILEYLVRQAKIDVSKTSASGETALDLARSVFDESSPRRKDPLVLSALRLLEQPISQIPLNTGVPPSGDPASEPPVSATPVPVALTPPSSPSNNQIKRSDNVKRLLNMHIPDIRKPVPYRESVDSSASSIACLKAENEALRAEVERLRDLVNKMNPEEQLKRMYARLVQIEAIECQLKNIS